VLNCQYHICSRKDENGLGVVDYHARPSTTSPTSNLSSRTQVYHQPAHFFEIDAVTRCDLGFAVDRILRQLSHLRIYGLNKRVKGLAHAVDFSSGKIDIG